MAVGLPPACLRQHGLDVYLTERRGLMFLHLRNQTGNWRASLVYNPYRTLVSKEFTLILCSPPLSLRKMQSLPWSHHHLSDCCQWIFRWTRHDHRFRRHQSNLQELLRTHGSSLSKRNSSLYGRLLNMVYWIFKARIKSSLRRTRSSFWNTFASMKPRLPLRSLDGSG